MKIQSFEVGSLNTVKGQFLYLQILLVCCFLIGFAAPSELKAQVPEIEWEGNYGGSDWDFANSIQSTDDGGYIVAGYSRSDDGDISGHNGGTDFWVVKLDGSGSIEWEESYGGSAGEQANSIQTTDDGGYIVAGFSASDDGDVSGNAWFIDYWVVKLDDTGNIEWEENYGGSGNEYAQSIQQTDDGGYIVAGESNSNDEDVSGNNGAWDYWIVKLDDSGSIEWEESYGGSGWDKATSIQTTNEGGYIVAGYSDSDDGDVSGNNGLDDIWIVKLDDSGSIEWEGNYGGSFGEQAHSIQATGDGGYIMVGPSSSSDGDVSEKLGDSDYWVVKLDGSGSIEWEGSYGGSSGNVAESIQVTDDGGYIVAGQSNSDDGDVSGNNGGFDYWVVKLDGSGSIEWEENYGGSDWDRAHSIQSADDGGYIVAGYSKSSDGDVSGNNGNEDFWVVKLSGDTDDGDDDNDSALTTEFRDPPVENACAPTESTGEIDGENGAEGELTVACDYSDGDLTVESLTLGYEMGAFFGEPTRAAAFKWEGSGSISDVNWGAAVVDEDGKQFVIDGEPVYAAWEEGTFTGPGEGYGSDVTGSPSWDATFMFFDTQENEFYEGVSEDLAKDIYQEDFVLQDLFILEINDKSLNEDGDGGEYPAEITAEAQVTFGEASTSRDYRLVALPGAVDEPLESIVNGNHEVDWQAFRDDGSEEDYLITYDGSDVFTFKPGNGFWMTGTEPLEYSETVSTVELNSMNQVSIPLQEGWNIISNPLDTDVAWSAVEQVNNGHIQPAWSFDGSFREADELTSAKTGEAFYFLNDQGLSELLIPYQFASQKSKKADQPPEIRLATTVGKEETSSSSIVFVRGEDEGVRSDVVAPPSGFEGASLRFTGNADTDRKYKRAESFARLYRSYNPEGQRFEVILQAESDRPVTITANGWDQTLAEALILQNIRTGTTYDLTHDNGITLNPEERSEKFLLIIGSGSYVEEQGNEFLPKQVNVEPNYPNPFNPTTTLQFALPEQAEVRVQVYDMIGRQVATLINNEVRKAGIHTITFDASRQASGLYFAVFEIGQQRFTQKMMLIK